MRTTTLAALFALACFAACSSDPLKFKVDPKVASAVLHIFLRVVEAHLRRQCPGNRSVPPHQIPSPVAGEGQGEGSNGPGGLNGYAGGGRFFWPHCDYESRIDRWSNSTATESKDETFSLPFHGSARRGNGLDA